MAVDDYGPAVLATTWGLFFLTSVIVGLRVYTRAKYSKFGYDDWATLVCWFVFLVTAVVVALVVPWGYGKHIYDIPAADQPRARQGQVISTVAAILSFASPKFGIMATVQRATNPPSASWRRIFQVNWALCIASFVFLAGVSVYQFLQCAPVAYQWELVAGAGRCLSPAVNIGLAYASSALSTVLDVYFSLLPAAIIWKLQMSPRNRVTMIIILGGASSATVASLVKMWKLGGAIAHIAEDPTYAMCEVFILVDVETTLLITGSSVAAIFPLLKHLNLRLRGLTTPGNNDYHHTTGPSHGNGNNKNNKNNNHNSGSTPLKTFGQWTSRPRRAEEDVDDDDDYDDDDETTLTRGDALAGTRRGGGGGGGRSSSTHTSSLEGHIVKTTDVQQTWGPADAEELEPKSAERKLGLTRGMF